MFCVVFSLVLGCELIVVYSVWVSVWWVLRLSIVRWWCCLVIGVDGIICFYCLIVMVSLDIGGSGLGCVYIGIVCIGVFGNLDRLMLLLSGLLFRLFYG